MALDEVTPGGLNHPGHLAGADIHTAVAPFAECASRRKVHQIWNRPSDGGELPRSTPSLWKGIQEADRIGMFRALKEFACKGLLDYSAGVHHAHAVASLCDDSQVVGDQKQRTPANGYEILQELENLGLDCHIQSGRGLISYDKGRRSAQGLGNHNPLFHPPTQLVRVLFHHGLRSCNLDEPQHL